MIKLSPLIRELAASTVAVVSLDGLVALLYWVTTGNSPWLLILALGIAFGPAVALLTLTSPRR